MFALLFFLLFAQYVDFLNCDPAISKFIIYVSQILRRLRSIVILKVFWLFNHVVQ